MTFKAGDRVEGKTKANSRKAGVIIGIVEELGKRKCSIGWDDGSQEVLFPRCVKKIRVIDPNQPPENIVLGNLGVAPAVLHDEEEDNESVS